MNPTTTTNPNVIVLHKVGETKQIHPTKKIFEMVYENRATKQTVTIVETDKAFQYQGRSACPVLRKAFSKIVEAYVEKGVAQHDYKGGFEEAISVLEVHLIKEKKKPIQVAEGVTIDLMKHEIDSHFLTSWYTLKIGKQSINFQVDEFVPELITEEASEAMSKVHCTVSDPKRLLDGCLIHLKPFLPTIINEAKEFLKLPQSRQIHLMNEFSCKFEVKGIRKGEAA